MSEINGLFIKDDYRIKDISCPNCKSNNIDFDSLNTSPNSIHCGFVCFNCHRSWDSEVNIEIKEEQIIRKFMVITEKQENLK